MTLPPTDKIPAAMAFSRRSPEILVSIPIIKIGRLLLFFKTVAPAIPNLKASVGVRSSFAMPLTPSVPKNFPI